MTNLKRCKWDHEVDPRCQFCKSDLETTIHIFCECKYLKKLWQSFAQWLKYMFQIEVEFKPDTVIYNNNNKEHKLFVNSLILTCKYYIYATKCAKKELNFRNM